MSRVVDGGKSSCIKEILFKICLYYSGDCLHNARFQSLKCTLKAVKKGIIIRMILKYIPFKFKIIEQILDVSLDMKCVYTKRTIYSDIHCMSGWPPYIKCWTYFA